MSIIPLVLLALTGSPTGPLPRVPDGFSIEKAAGEAVVFPMFAAFDDRGRLFVAESSGLDLYAELEALTRKCRVVVLEDGDGDGRYERVRPFAERLVFPMGLAWRDGSLYVADPPDLVAFDDRDGDGVAGERKVILTGFGHQDNGSLHGLIFGPDGLLYMTMGSPDGYRLAREDGTALTGRSGALIRSRPDGSRPEVLARGFENLVEVAFTPEGDVLGTLNWIQEPRDGLRDALVHLVEGGLYPRVPDQGTRYPVTGPPLPGAALFPAVALSGLEYYRGAQFPADMRGNLFSAQHNSRKVGRHELIRETSTFRTRDHDFVTSDDPDFHPADVLEDADGTLLVVDTGGWYVQHCPTGRIRNSRAPGGIYRVRWRDAKAVADPRGLAQEIEALPPVALARLLADPRPALRDRARGRLAALGDAAAGALATVLSGDTDLAVKREAAWALAAGSAGSALEPLRRALQAREPEVAALAARALGRKGDRESEPDLRRLLAHDDLRVRLAAAEALARSGGPESAPALLAALAAAPDRFLEHAAAHALHSTARDEDLAAAAGDPRPQVARTALVLLDQRPGALEPERVLRLASAPDPGLRETALRVLAGHPDWSSHAGRAIGEILRKPALTAGEDLGFRALVAAFAGRGEVSALLATSLAGGGGNLSDERLVLVLEALAAAGAEGARPLFPDIARLMNSPAVRIRAAAVRLAAALQAAELAPALEKVADDGAAPADLRLEALRAVAARRPEVAPDLFDLAHARLGDESPLVRLAGIEALSRCRLSDEQLARVIDVAGEDPLLAPATVVPIIERSLSERTAAPALGAVLDYLQDSLRGGWRPRVEDLARLVKAFPDPARGRAGGLLAIRAEAAAGDADRLRDLEPLLAGGDPMRGRAVFFGKQAACSTCHRIRSEGGTTGPDLTKVGAVRSGRDLLESVVFPSSTFAQGYDVYAVVAEDGSVATGVIARQSAQALVLRGASGAEVHIPREDVHVMERQSSSLMPEGLDRTLTREELRDLFAWLQALR